MKALRFSPRSERALEDIAAWTSEQFGPRQAEVYSAELLSRCRDIASGSAIHQSCRAAFAPDLRRDLRFVRSGRHFIIFTENAERIVVLDFVHQSADAAGRLRDLKE